MARQTRLAKYESVIEARQKDGAKLRVVRHLAIECEGVKERGHLRLPCAARK
jgi:hypothetical protein